MKNLILLTMIFITYLTSMTIMGKSKDSITISGKVMHTSDVASIPDIPYSRGYVIAIKKEDWSNFLNENGMSKVKANELQFGVKKENADKYYKTKINEDGKYEAKLEKGQYHLCLANITKSPRSKYPLTIFGCTKLKSFTKSTTGTSISLGFGGVF